jgi:uncharacterized protein YjbI with pentapeptide repeats
MAIMFMKTGQGGTAWLPVAMAPLLAALLLASCGGGGGSVPPVRQFGVVEPQLKNAGGGSVVPGPGSGLVVSQLEPAGGAPAPLMGDSASVGVDEITFQVDYSSSVSIHLTSESLSTVSEVVLLDSAGAIRFSVSADNTQAQAQLAPGTYTVRLTSAAGATEVVSAMLWFGGVSSLASATDLQKLLTGNCAGCNLQGANLSAIDLKGINLAGADLRGAILVQVAGGLKLNGSDVMTILLASSDVVGADLTGSNLAGVKLSGAYLTGSGQSPARLGGVDFSSALATDLLLPRADLHGANLKSADLSRSVLTSAVLRGANLSNAILANTDLSNADLSGANLLGADFSGAKLSGAIWTDQRVCASPSVGACL